MATFIYILFSPSQNKTYTGCAASIEKRLLQHNRGYVKATKSGAPWQLIYSEELDTSLDARRRERYFKSAAGRRKIKQIFTEYNVQRRDG